MALLTPVKPGGKNHKATEGMGTSLNFSLLADGIRKELPLMDLRKCYYWGAISNENAYYSYVFILPSPKTLSI